MKDLNNGELYFSNAKYRRYYQRYLQILHAISVNRFEWVGLPDEIVPQFIEEQLFWRGEVVFFKDDVLNKYAVMRTALGGSIDIYDTPNKRTAYAQNYIEHLNKKNSVLIKDNTINYPLVDIAVMYAESLANMRMTRDINIYAQRTPVVVSTSENTRLSSKNTMKMYNDFVPVIEIKDTFKGVDGLKVLDLKPPKVFDDLRVEMREEISDFCTIIGVDNLAGQKKERLVSDEVYQQSNVVQINRHNYLSVRERAAEQISRLFGLKVSVKYVGGQYFSNGEFDEYTDVSRETRKEVE